MSQNLPPIRLQAKTWTNLYTESGLTVGQIFNVLDPTNQADSLLTISANSNSIIDVDINN